MCKSKRKLKFTKAYEEVVKGCHVKNAIFKPIKIIELAEKKFNPIDEHDS
jgi:hypothetical protein